jgi:hypothetical protein
MFTLSLTWFILMTTYSATSLLRPPLGLNKSGLLGAETSAKLFELRPHQ